MIEIFKYLIASVPCFIPANILLSFVCFTALALVFELGRLTSKDCNNVVVAVAIHSNSNFQSKSHL